MSIHAHPTLVKGLTVAVALTLMSGFVFYRHRGGNPSLETMTAALPIDSPETEAGAKPVRLDSFYMDRSLPSSKSGTVFPPEGQPRQVMLYSSKSARVFEPPALPSLMTNDSVLRLVKAQDTLE